MAQGPDEDYISNYDKLSEWRKVDTSRLGVQYGGAETRGKSAGGAFIFGQDDEDDGREDKNDA